MGRAHYTTAGDQRAGCDTCDGVGLTNPNWFGRNALPLAARHHKATGHTTWAEQVIYAQWGERDRG